MCEKSSCGDNSKKLMNKLTDEPDTHEFIIIEWRYNYSQPVPNYSGGYSTTAYTYTLAPSTTNPQSTTTTPAQTNAPNYHFPFPPLEGSINVPSSVQLLSITAVRVMCTRCGFIKII